MKKKLFTLLLVLGLMLCLATSVSAEEVGGTFKDCTWSYDTDTYTLTIGGEGTMGSFFITTPGWALYKPEIRTIIIEEGVTDVGDYAFKSCSSLTSVTLPESLTSIEDEAFYGCTALTQIQFPSNLETIGESAFYGSALTSLEFPASLKTIGRQAFYSCKSLLSLTIPSTLETIGNSAFHTCQGLTKVTIEEGVKEISSHAFHGCTNLLDVTIPGSITTWGINSFTACTNLRTVTISDGVSSIPNETFYGCENLMKVSLPASLSTIGDRAFQGCKLLMSLEIPEGVDTIGSEAFRNCITMAKITLPSTLTSTGTAVFNDCDALTQMTIPGSLAVVNSRLFEGCDKLETVIFEEGISTLKHSAFQNCPSLKEVSLPASLTTVEAEVFYNCDSLTKVTFQSGAFTIGNSAFAYCEKLAEVILSDTLQSIGSDAFQGCTALKTITIPGSVTTIGSRAFTSSGLQSIKLESGVMQLSNNALSGARDLIYAVLPDTLLLINDYNFGQSSKFCHALITGPNNDIIVNKGNDPYVNAVKHFNAKGDEITLHEDCVSVYAYCSICDKAIYIEAKKNAQHTFGEWIQTVAPTTQAEGEETRTCTVCDCTETRPIAKLPPQKNPFTDVPENKYYYEPIIWAVNEGITTGITDTTFEPNAISTRAHVVTFLWRCAGCPEPKTGLNPFEDVVEGKFYYKAVLWAVENGITNGTSDTTFSPSQNCTRGHVVTFLHRYLNKPVPEVSNNPFNDVAEGKFYYDAVLWAVDAGVTTGTSATTFSPSNECKRCEIVTFLYRALFK